MIKREERLLENIKAGEGLNKALGVIFLAFVFITGCSGAEEHNVEDQEVSIPVVAETEVIAEELHIPWSINRNGNTFYLSEKPGDIVKVEEGKRSARR